MEKISRGMRNKNPLNIKIGNDWRGEVLTNTDGVFEQFESLPFGYRAAFIILRKYIFKYIRNTIRKIIESWSPDGAVIVNAYINAVSKMTGLKPDAKLDWNDRDAMVNLVRAMANVECGHDVDIAAIEKGYDLANMA